MIGVTCAPAAATRSRQASCSSRGEAQATWWTVPAPPIPGPSGGVHHPRAGTALARAGVFEKRDVGPGVAVFVRVEEVVDGGVVLVDGLLYKPQPEQPRVELDVPRRVRGDGGDVMDAFEL